jgi:hypothetical protein
MQRGHTIFSNSAVPARRTLTCPSNPIFARPVGSRGDYFVISRLVPITQLARLPARAILLGLLVLPLRWPASRTLAGTVPRIFGGFQL